MSKNKKRTPEEKMQIVLEALQNNNISETCRKHGIYESQFYQWKKRLIGSADKVFKNKKKKDPEKEKLKNEVDRLKQTLVEQTCELQILKKKRQIGLYGQIKGDWLNAEQKRQLMNIVEESSLPITTTCEILQLNSWRYYSWRKRYQTHGMNGLKNHKSTPSSCPHTLLEEERQAIIDYALKNPDIHHRKLSKMMIDNDIAYVSASSVYRVLKEENLIPEQEYHSKREANGQIKVDKPNKMWHTDITYIPIKDKHAYLISVLDGYSRKIIHGELSQTMTSNDMKRILSRAMFKADLFEKPADQRPVLISDNGTQLVSKSFTRFLQEWDIKHIRTAVKHPETNGKIEVFHKTVKYENVYVKELYQSFYEAKEDIEDFIEHYNSIRLHQGIDFVTPNQKYNGQAAKIIKDRISKHQRAIKRRKRLNRNQREKVA